jgi:hypothetical protein
MTTRKPVDQQQPSECRQAVWDEIRSQSAHGSFSCREIADCTRLHVSSVREYMTGLCNAGYLAKADRPMPDSHKAQYFRLDRDCGVDAPRVKKDGSPVTMGQGRQQMWNSMPVLKVFSPRDLAFNASTETHGVAEREAATYCQILCAAGYLIAKGVNRYVLVPARWTGPQPPQIQRTKQLYDPNLRKVVWSRVEGGAQ